MNGSSVIVAEQDDHHLKGGREMAGYAVTGLDGALNEVLSPTTSETVELTERELLAVELKGRRIGASSNVVEK